MNVYCVEARANTWNRAADGIIEKLKSKNVRRGQVLCIDAHNNGKKEEAIFSAFFDVNHCSHENGDFKYESQNSTQSWENIYSIASDQTRSVDVNDIVGMTGCCNFRDGKDLGVFYVFSQTPSCRSIGAYVAHVEARGSSWDAAADKLIEKLQNCYVGKGQILSIDAHNNGEGTDAIFSAHYSKELENNGESVIKYVRFNESSSWAEMYEKCCKEANKIARENFISITASINTGDRVKGVIYMFYHEQ